MQKQGRVWVNLGMLAIAVAMMFAAASADAANITYLGSGDWTLVSPDDTTGPGWPVTTGLPGNGDNARIQDGQTITVSTAVTMGSGNVQPGVNGSGAQVIEIVSGGELTANQLENGKAGANNTAEIIVRNGGKAISTANIPKKKTKAIRPRGSGRLLSS